ncbi:MAG TPA: MarR family transcriptional regulator [Acidothermaceae bacterium]|nr:MarR family transcriptional regulator [Acidothermaceae bacterium]
MAPIEADDVTRLRAAIGRLSRQLNASVVDVGFSPSQLSVLGSVCRRGPLGVGELAEIEGINPTMLSRIVGKLDDAGLIVRIAHPDDGRAVVVQATAAGRKLQERVQGLRSKALADRLQKLAPHQITELVAALPALEALAAR